MDALCFHALGREFPDANLRIRLCPFHVSNSPERWDTVGRLATRSRFPGCLDRFWPMKTQIKLIF